MMKKNNSLILRDVADKDIYNKLIKNEKVKNCKLKTAYNKIKSYFEEDENNADDLTVKIENIVQWAKVLIDKIIVN
jgi:ubiquitin